MSEEEESTSPYGPLTLSSTTKELFDLDGLTSENISLFIPKEQILEDIKARADESEFKQYEEQITQYPEDNLKIILDTERKYGKEYVLCLTPEVSEIPFSEAVSATESDTELAEKEKDAEKSEYIEESIEDQIKAERNVDSRAKIEMTVIRNEKIERRPLQLSSKMPSDNKELYLEILPEGEYYESEGEEEGEEGKAVAEPIYRKTRDWGCQESVYLRTGFSQTAKPNLANASAQTEIKLFNEKEKDKIWKTSTMRKFLHVVEKRLFDALVEISAGGLEKPWSYLRSLESEVASGRDAPLTMSRSYICVSGDESKMISSVEWHPVLNDVFVVATIQNKSFEEQVDHLTNQLLAPCLLYVWSIQDHLLPRLILDSCDEVLCIKFNTTMPHLIVGGCSSGQLVLWDLSSHLEELEKTVDYDWARHSTSYDVSELGGNTVLLKSPTAQHCASSSIDHSHLLGTHCLEWIPAGIEILLRGEVCETDSTESFQLVTCGFDGSLRFWDLRCKEEGVVPTKSKFLSDSIYHALDLAWRPFHVVDVPPPEGQKRLCLMTFTLKLSEKRLTNTETEPEAEENEKGHISTIFFAGSEDGRVLRCSFQQVKNEIGNFGLQQPEYFTSVQGIHVHGGTVVGIYPSPFLENIFCSIGGKTMAIWNEKLLKGPLFLDINKVLDITTGHWSQTRPAIFMLGFHDGSLQIWDLLQSCHQPVLLQSIASAAITSITTHLVSDSEQILAIGDGDGFVHILNLPLYLWKSEDSELDLFQKFLDREAQRVTLQINEQVVIDARKLTEAKRLEEERKRQAEQVAETEEEEETEKSLENEAELLSETYEEFLKLEKKCLTKLGYIVEEVKVTESEKVGES